MSLRVLRHDKMAHGTHHPLLALDIENNPKTGAFICAGLYGKVGQSRIERVNGRLKRVQTDQLVKGKYFSSQAKLFDYLLKLKKGSCKLVFYNLSYDIVFLRDILAPPTINKDGSVKQTLLQVGTRVITATLKNGLKCLDLYNHTCEGSLEDWGKYCKFEERFGVKKHDLSDLSIRVLTDAELTYRLGEFIEDFYYNECRIPLQLTVGSSALKIFLSKYFYDFWQRDDEPTAAFERQAYYGGRTEIFQRGSHQTYSYDINSTYLSIMRDEVLPDISSIRHRNWGDEYINDLGKNLDKHLAIIECLVRAPENIQIGCLPVRVDGKLTFPGGEFRGTWCSVELSYAISQGYQIKQVYRYKFYLKSKSYFREFANFVWKKRLEYRACGNQGMDKMIKRIGNSLYGKFGERNGSETNIKLSELTFPIPEGAEIYEYLGEYWLRIKGEKIPSPHEFPCIPAFITAYARVKLLQGMLANNKSLIYVDTDSLKTTMPARGITVGDKLGEWKDEGNNQTVFYRCKFYGDKHKGVPKKAVIAEQTDTYITYKFDAPMRERQAMRRNMIPNVWTEQFKTLIFEDDKRVWTDNTSMPKTLYYELENILLTKNRNDHKIKEMTTKTRFKPTGSATERELNREKMKEVQSYRMRKPLGTMVEETTDFKRWTREQETIYLSQQGVLNEF